MTKEFKKLFFALTIIATALSFSSCVKTDNSLSLYYSYVVVPANYEQGVPVFNAEGTLKASTANPLVCSAYIKEGALIVKGIYKGTTTVTVTDGTGATASMEVAVKDRTMQFAITSNNVSVLPGTISGADAIRATLESEFDASQGGKYVMINTYPNSEITTITGELLVYPTAQTTLSEAIRGTAILDMKNYTATFAYDGKTIVYTYEVTGAFDQSSSSAYSTMTFANDQTARFKDTYPGVTKVTSGHNLNFTNIYD